MKLIEESALKYLSVKLPMLGAFLMLVLVPLLQWALDFNLVPQQYAPFIVGTALPFLAWLGRKIYQPSLHQPIGFMSSKTNDLDDLFGVFRKLTGGKLTQAQVDQINAFLANFGKDSTSSGKVLTLSQSGIDLIANFEGFKAAAYLCPANVWTIGYGTTIYPNGTKVKKGDICTVDEAKRYKAHDLKRFEKTINDAVTVNLTQNQFDALVSLTYNIGSSAFTKSTLLKKLNAGDYAGAAAQFDVWNRVGVEVLQGLVNRRTAEKELFKKALI